MSTADKGSAGWFHRRHAASIVITLLWSTPLFAQTSTQETQLSAREVHVRVEGAAHAEACPSAEALEAALRPLLVDAQIRVAINADAARAQVTVRDAGESYGVTVGEATRTVMDPTRDCTERARVIAVFAALNLRTTPEAPPTLASEPTASEAAVTTPPVDAAPPAIDSQSLRTSVGIALVGSAQLPIAGGQLTGGAGLAAAWIHGAWHLGVDAIWLTSFVQDLGGDASSTVPDARVRVSRVPVTLSAAHLFPLGGVSLGPSLGVVFDVLRMRGEQVMRPQQETRLNVGARLAIDGRVPLSRAWHGVFQLHAWGYPRAYQLRVEPSGESGNTPRLWFGGNVGLEWRFGEFDSVD